MRSFNNPWLNQIERWALFHRKVFKTAINFSVDGIPLTVVSRAVRIFIVNSFNINRVSTKRHVLTLPEQRFGRITQKVPILVFKQIAESYLEPRATPSTDSASRVRGRGGRKLDRLIYPVYPEGTANGILGAAKISAAYGYDLAAFTCGRRNSWVDIRGVLELYDIVIQFSWLEVKIDLAHYLQSTYFQTL